MRKRSVYRSQFNVNDYQILKFSVATKKSTIKRFLAKQRLGFGLLLRGIFILDFFANFVLIVA